MPETDLQKPAIIESFLQINLINFSSERQQIFTMGENLKFHKVTFCGLFMYCFIRTDMKRNPFKSF